MLTDVLISIVFTPPMKCPAFLYSLACLRAGPLCWNILPGLFQKLWQYSDRIYKHVPTGLGLQVGLLFFGCFGKVSVVHQFVVKLKAVTSLNRMLQGLEPFTETACCHERIHVPSTDCNLPQCLDALSRSWLGGVPVPGHMLCSWIVTWTCYAIPLVWQPPT